MSRTSLRNGDISRDSMVNIAGVALFGALSFVGGAVLFSICATVWSFVVPRRKPLGFGAAVLIPLIIGIVFSGWIAAVAIREPGPTGEVVIMAIILPFMLVPPLVCGSLVGRKLMQFLGGRVG